MFREHSFPWYTYLAYIQSDQTNLTVKLIILIIGMLLIAILADTFSISIYYSTTLAGHFPINFWPHVAAISCYTFFKVSN